MDKIFKEIEKIKEYNASLLLPDMNHQLLYYLHLCISNSINKIEEELKNESENDN